MTVIGWFLIQYVTYNTWTRNTLFPSKAYLLTQDSIMSLDMSFSLCSRCFPNSSSGQCRSRMKVCRASSFQNRSSEVPEPLLGEQDTGGQNPPILCSDVETVNYMLGCTAAWCKRMLERLHLKHLEELFLFTIH